MQKYRLERKSIRDTIKGLETSFNVLPVIPRDCVKALNTLVYNLQNTTMDQKAFKEIIFLILRGYTSEDCYLKTYIYATLIELSRQTKDGILSINCAIKDLDSRKSSTQLKNIALRSLFSNLPPSMHYEFEKYVKMPVLDGSDNAVVVAAEYLKDMKAPTRISGDIGDFHLAFFSRLPINKYSSMVEMRRMVRENPEQIASFLFMSTDPVVFVEAAKGLLTLRPELAAPFVDKAVHVLAALTKRQGVETFCAVSILSQLSIAFPMKVAKANRELEELVHSPLHCVSMLAILTLLKTGTGETVAKLAAQLEPYMQSMSSSYRRMAIDTMEKLSSQQGNASSVGPYASFLKKTLLEKGELGFKRYILKKFEALLGRVDDKENIVKFLCTYLEDPEHYQISMDVLGILGGVLEDPADLVHIYNRLILDNGHVRKCAIQTLYDLNDSRALDGKINGIDAMLDTFCDFETQKICDFLRSCEGIKKGPFSLEELGDLRVDVAKYLEEESEEEAAVAEPELIKECRKIVLSPAGADFTVEMTKKIYQEHAVLEFFFKNEMDAVKLSKGLLTIELGAHTYSVELGSGDFEHGAASKEIQAAVSEGDVGNGVFEYQIYLEDDVEDAENDSMFLEPFSFTILDFVRPGQVARRPTAVKSIEIALDCKAPEAATKIIDTANLFLVADKNNLVMSGTYKGADIVIEALLRPSKVTAVSMDICCDSPEIIDRIVAVFD